MEWLAPYIYTNLSLTATGMSSVGIRHICTLLSYNSTLCVLVTGQEALVHDKEVK